MDKFLQWVIVLAADWEPPEDEEAQFIAEVAEIASLGDVNDFSYIPKDYLNQEDVDLENAADDSSILITFANAPYSALQEDELMSFLYSEMPAIFSGREDYEIECEQYLHPERECEGLIIFSKSRSETCNDLFDSLFQTYGICNISNKFGFCLIPKLREIFSHSL